MAGQPEAAPKGAGVKALSSRLLQMKFMKRGQAAETITKATSAAEVQARSSYTDCQLRVCLALGIKVVTV